MHYVIETCGLECDGIRGVGGEPNGVEVCVRGADVRPKVVGVDDVPPICEVLAE
jgi:hypothetical protein